MAEWAGDPVDPRPLRRGYMLGQRQKHKRRDLQ